MAADLVRNQAPELGHSRPSANPLAVVVFVDVHYQLVGLLLRAGILRQRQLYRFESIRSSDTTHPGRARVHTKDQKGGIG